MQKSTRTCLPNLFVTLVAAILPILLLQSCTGHRPVYFPGPAIQSPPAEYRPQTGSAAALYAEAEKALHAGRYTTSEMLLERALRIEPRNPHYWYTMALVKYRQGLYPQTVQLCLKTHSLAGNQPQLTSRNRTLMEQAAKKIEEK